MAKPNYSYEKRQRELAKKQKKEEKSKRKSEGGAEPDDANQTLDVAPQVAADATGTD